MHEPLDIDRQPVNNSVEPAMRHVSLGVETFMRHAPPVLHATQVMNMVGGPWGALPPRP